MAARRADISADWRSKGLSVKREVLVKVWDDRAGSSLPFKVGRGGSPRRLVRRMAVQGLDRETFSPWESLGRPSRIVPTDEMESASRIVPTGGMANLAAWRRGLL